jgi:hypothetical protein
VDRRGLIRRFTEERTLTQSDCRRFPFWDPASRDIAERRPEPHGLIAASGLGFELWLEKLKDRLADWGHLINGSPRDPGSWASLSVLRRRWFLDWAEECWGPEIAARWAVELDPWVRAAVAELPGAESEACSSPATMAARTPGSGSPER